MCQASVVHEMVQYICHRQRSYQFLLQRVSVAVQRGNSVAVVGSLGGSLDWGLEGF